MAMYSITYDLRKQGRNYTALYSAIKSLGDWSHYLESTWLVRTSMDGQAIQERLVSQIDANDRLLVIRCTCDAYGYMPKEAWQWIETHCHAV